MGQHLRFIIFIMKAFVAVLSCLVAAAKAGNYAATGLGYATGAIAAPAALGYGAYGYAGALAAPGYLGYGVASPYDYAGQVYPAAEPYLHLEVPAEPYVHEEIAAEPYVHEEVAAEPYVHEEILA